MEYAAAPALTCLWSSPPTLVRRQVEEEADPWLVCRARVPEFLYVPPDSSQEGRFAPSSPESPNWDELCLQRCLCRRLREERKAQPGGMQTAGTGESLLLGAVVLEETAGQVEPSLHFSSEKSPALGSSPRSPSKSCLAAPQWGEALGTWGALQGDPALPPLPAQRTGHVSELPVRAGAAGGWKEAGGCWRPGRRRALLPAPRRPCQPR